MRLECIAQHLGACTCQLIVPSRRPLFFARAQHRFPLRAQESRVLEPVENRIHRPAWQFGVIDYVKAVTQTSTQSCEDERGWTGQSNRR